MLVLLQNAVVERLWSTPLASGAATCRRMVRAPPDVPQETPPADAQTGSSRACRLGRHFLAALTFALPASWAPASAHAQPVPVELAVGQRYATANLVVSKTFADTSRLGFFHLSTISTRYEDTSRNDLAIQNLVFFELAGGLRVAGGAFHTERGFSPTLGMQYVRAGRDLFVLFAPRVNIESDPSYSVFSIVRWKPALTESTRLYLGAQMLNTFDSSRHIKSYQWLRVGLEIKGTQFGLAVNVDEDGTDPAVRFSLGFFLRREIF